MKKEKDIGFFRKYLEYRKARKQIIEQKKINYINQRKKEEYLKDKAIFDNMSGVDFYVKAKPFDPTPIGWNEKRKEKKFKSKHPDKFVLIRMEMSNGSYREFLAADDFGVFFYKKKAYVQDIVQKYYIIERDLWAYDYQEDLSLPIRKHLNITEDVNAFLNKVEDELRKPKPAHIDTSEIKTLVESAKLVDVDTSLNPTTLKRFIDSEVIKQVLQGAMLGRIVKVLFIIIIVMGIILLLDFITSLYSAGIFEKIGDMFHRK